MTGQVIARDALGDLTKLGQGGQGIVYRAPKAKTAIAESMVFKEYKPDALKLVNFPVLSAMPVLVEEGLSRRDAEKLIAIAAWPCRIVESQSVPVGFLMPAIPSEFVIELTTVKGISDTFAEFQHVLNNSSVLAARGINIDDSQRYALLRELAASMAFLHRIGVCVGDISPKNLLFSLTPGAAVYFIDCDAMRVNGKSALPQVETPGWEVPASEELATVESDLFKLGLLALRLLAGDQETRNVEMLPSDTPSILRQLITDTLTNPPGRRPLPEAWTYVLGHAAEKAQHRRTSPKTPPSQATPEPIAVVRTRPAAVSGPPPTRPAPIPVAPPTSASLPSITGWWGFSANPWGWLGGIAVAGLIALVVALGIAGTNSSGNDHSSSRSEHTSTLTSGYPVSTTTTWEPTASSSAAPPTTSAAHTVTAVTEIQWSGTPCIDLRSALRSNKTQSTTDQICSSNGRWRYTEEARSGDLVGGDPSMGNADWIACQLYINGKLDFSARANAGDGSEVDCLRQVN